jgi:3-phosphoshikimate 1-carboxyvinyltransferase
MVYKVSRTSESIKGTVSLTPSKSESNRALIIRELCEQPFDISNLSPSEDTQTLHNILEKEKLDKGKEAEYNVGAAGTTMRFLTAYFALRPGTHILKGSERMHKRPIKVLVDALNTLGAKIEYLGEPGYPPLKIHGGTLRGGEISIDGSVSSQYISALLMIAPSLPLGLVMRFTGEIASRPYINMTLKLMDSFGVSGMWQDHAISVSPQRYSVISEEEGKLTYPIEADWSAASYWYAIAAFAKEADITLLGLKRQSLQGDALLPDLFRFFGVSTEFIEEGIRLTKGPVPTDRLAFDFNDCPDIVQSVAVVSSALGISCLFKGLSTLKLKETDRAQALKNELLKFGIDTKIMSDDAALILDQRGINTPIKDVISTYDDHRMAMAFATLAMKTGEIRIENPAVVSKSYPTFWDDMKAMGFKIEEV